MGEYADSLKKRNSTKASEAVEAAREAAAAAKARAKANAAQEARDAARSRGRNSPVSSQYPTGTLTSPSTDFVLNPKKSDKPKVVKEKYKISKEVAPDSSNLVDGVNISELFVKAKTKIVLSLIRNSKTLLGRYNFSGIDRITDYSLDADNSARQSEIVVSYIRPNPTYSLTEAMEQDVFMKNINKINNQLNDFADDSVKFLLFGYNTPAGFKGATPKIVNGQARYDLQFGFYTSSGKVYRYRLYEIS
jgi:hypothetical protein